MLQQVLLESIRETLSKDSSLNEVVATALEISYDAAHRRTSLKSKLSIEEGVTLAKYCNISLDELFGLAHQQYVAVEKTKEISNEVELQQYFENSYQSLLPLLDRKDCQVYYSAKDIPLFYTLQDNRLSHFKCYVWLKLLDKKFRNIHFDTYVPQLSTLQAAKRLGGLYSNLQASEIWDITTINSTLKQIHFYYKAGQLSLSTALELCEELKQLLNEISVKVISKKTPFQLYYNELLLMNNNVLVMTPEKQSLYVPTSMLAYYVTSDKQTCAQAKSYFEKQFQHSKLLNASGEKEQNTFYHKMMQKVEALMQLIKASEVLDFE